MSKSKFLGVALATFVAFAFMGCDEVKGLAASVSIEEPLVEIAYDNSGEPYLSIQSQDNDTVIEDIIINRGNCAVFKWMRDSGSFVHATKELCEKTVFEDKIECKLFYPKKLPYGERHSPVYKCRADTIIKVELVVNGGGHLTYKFK